MVDTYGTSGAQGADDPWKSDGSGLSDQYEDLFQIASTRISGLLNAGVHVVGANPVVAAAIIAGLSGAVIGSWLARRPRSRREVLAKEVEEQAKSIKKQAERARSESRKVGRAIDYGELVPLAIKLFENPVVRTVAVQMITKRLAKRFG